MTLARSGVCLLLLFVLVGSPSGSHAQIDPADEIFYHFMPIAWRDSDGDPERFGDFGGMTASLDYLEDLGITAIWMNPIFPSPAYHGYQHGPADLFNSWFGSETEFVDFLEAAHSRGIKIFVDLVAYGISHDSIWFQDAFGNPSSLYDDWLAFTNPANTDYLGSTFTTWNGDIVGFIHWDLRHPGPVDLVTTWAQRLLDPNTDGTFLDGLDGYRLDHVWVEYPEGPDGWGYNLDTFWIPWREALRTVNPEVLVFAEQAQWGSHGAELLPGLDAVFTKPFESSARWALFSEESEALYYEMAATLNALSTAPDGTMLCTISNHDVDRLASAIGNSFEKGKAAATILMTQPFPPVIYYGDEIGMRGTKNTSYIGDAADIPMREPFKWNAVAGPPMSNYFVLNNDAYQNRISRDNDGRSVEEQEGDSESLLETYRELIGARTDNIALRRGSYTAIENSSVNVWAFLRHHDSQSVMVVVNLSGQARSISLDLGDFAIEGESTVPADILTGELLPAIDAGNQDAYPLTFDAYGYRLLDVDLFPPLPPASLVDGRNIPEDFGQQNLRATQNNGTGLGDNLSELDQLYIESRGDTVFLGVTGNLENNATGFALFVDTGDGGQNMLDLSNIEPPPYGPRELTGLLFDAGFSPKYLYYINSIGDEFWLDRFELRDFGGADKDYRGSGIVNSGTGFLSGGTNPNSVQVAFDNTNTEGVTESDASGAATATTGFEIYMPREELELPSDGSSEVGIALFLMRSDGTVSNQWLPGLGGGYGNLGLAPDMTSIPGDQFLLVTLEPESTGTNDPPPTGGAIDLQISTQNPFLDQITFSFNLPSDTEVSLEVYDTVGSLVRVLIRGKLQSGDHRYDWKGDTDSGRSAPAGVYFGRLETTGTTRVVRVILVRG